MAMAVDDRSLPQYGRAITGSFPGQEFSEREGLLIEAHRIFIVRQKIYQFIPEHRTATWLQHNDRCARFDVGSQFVQDVFKIFAGWFEKTEVVERSAAAHVLARNKDIKSS